MKTKFLFCLVTILLFMNQSFATNDNVQEDWRYDIECAGDGVQGTYLVKIFTYSKSKKPNNEIFKKDAVHGVLFRGFSSSNKSCKAQKPIIKDPAVKEDKADFFKIFFSDKGDYSKYASITSSTPEIIKVGKEYKIGMVVSVSKDLLRSDLEEAGIIRGLSDGF